MTNLYGKAETAQRYVAARALAPETATRWMETVRKQLPARAVHQVVDLGCGAGRFSVPLHEAFHAPVVGIEPSEAMLAEARKLQHPNLVWRVGFAEQLPLDDQTVDLVWMSQVVHHPEAPARAFAEV